MSASTPPFRMLIAEGDASTAAAYRRVVAKLSWFEVAGVVTRGEDAIELLNRTRCHLLLLDLDLAGMSGLALLQALRTSAVSIEIIAATAERRSATVRSVVQYGAIDYLVKPFSIDRLRQSLGLFLHRAAALRNAELDQEAIDRVCAPGRVMKRWTPKGITADGLARVREALTSNGSRLSSTDVAVHTGLARVTARRYLEYLVVTDQAIVDAPPCGPGRPTKLYSLA